MPFRTKWRELKTFTPECCLFQLSTSFKDVIGLSMQYFGSYNPTEIVVVVVKIHSTNLLIFL